MSTSSAATDHILVSSDTGIFRIQFNRPVKKNALTLAMYTALVKALHDAEADPQVRVIYITGSPDCFTAGNDILDFMNNPPTDAESPVAQFLECIATAGKPIVAAVSGAAIGIGTTLLLHCDLVYAGSKAVFRLPFVNLALCPEAASSFLLPRLMGYQRAAELLMLGEKFNAERAQEFGIVNEVFPHDELDARAMAKARQLAAQPPESVRITKALMKRGQAQKVREAMEAEGAEFMQRLTSPEAAEAFQAFIEGRKPDFSRFV